jgi:urate oxidase
VGMAIVMGPNNYGKSAVHLVKVRRDTPRHEVKDVRVDVALSGDLDAIHTQGDNTNVMATDTMRNTVYALAAEHSLDTVEEFGLYLVDYLLTTPLTRGARVHLVEQRWDRIQVDSRGHDHCFTRAAGGRHVATVEGSGDERHVEAGIEDLPVLKTTQSGWENFLQDKYRTLKDTGDRILATIVAATWSYHEPKADFARIWGEVSEQLLTTFTDHFSPSVQNTLYLMGKAVLERCPEIEKIRISLPNKHHILLDLSTFGLDNNNEIFFVTVEPYGLIEGTVQRGD